jgi:steroid delta-isomerase
VAFPFKVTAGAPGQEIVINIIDVFKFNDEGKVATMRAFWGPDNMAT